MARRNPARFLRTVALLAVFAFLSSSVVRAARQAYTLDRAVRELEQTRTNLLDQNRRLREEIRRLHDLSYIERRAREELGLVRPDEITVVVIPTRKGGRR